MKNNSKFSKSEELSAAEIEKRWTIPLKDLVAPDPINKPNKNNPIDFAILKHFVTANADRLDDNEGIMELLPDLELVRETLVANILSPKDLRDVQLNVTLHKEAPPELAEIINTHFSTVFDLSSKLATILGQSLFSKGSYILMPLPPATISRVINPDIMGLESLSSRLNNLPNRGIIYTNDLGVNYSMESVSIASDDGVKRDSDKGLLEITDNIDYLLTPAVKEHYSKKRIKNILQTAFGIEDIKDTHKATESYNYKSSSYVPLVTLDYYEDAGMEGKMNPVVLTLPPESVIPVHVPGDPTNHVGYYIFLDDEGNPIHLTLTTNKYKELNNRLKQTMENQTLMNQIGIGVTYANGTRKSETSSGDNKALLKAYQEQFEKDLLEAVSKGATGRAVEVSNPEEVYRIMFARQLAKQKTRVVYVPAEMISYIAFNYNESGMGVSLLDKTKLYASFRAILTFASVLSGVNSSINRRTLSITLDDDDTDPQGTVDQILNEYVALQASGIPIGRLNPLDIVDSLQKAGMQIKIAGGARFPGTDLDVSETKREITPPDSGIMDMLKDAHYSGLWVTRESIDRTADVDFAASITASNLFQSKRYSAVQHSYIKQLSGFMKKYISMGGPLYQEIKESFNGLKKSTDLTLKDLIDSISVALPKADTAFITTQSTDYTDYCGFIENAVDVYISENMMKDMLQGENISSSIEDVKAAVLNILKRQYLRSENMLPELDSLLTNPDTNIEEMLSQHNETIIKLVGDVLRHTRKTEKHEDDLINKDNPPPPDGSMDDGSSEGGGDDLSGGSDDDLGDLGTGSDDIQNDDSGTDDLNINTEPDDTSGTKDEPNPEDLELEENKSKDKDKEEIEEESEIDKDESILDANADSTTKVDEMEEETDEKDIFNKEEEEEEEDDEKDELGKSKKKIWTELRSKNKDKDK